MILTVGEALAEFMRPQPGEGLDRPGELLGPYPSGAPAIFASVAARLGSETALCAVVGEDAFGALIRRRLGEDGVELSAIRTEPNAFTATSFVAYERDGTREFVFHVRESAAGRLLEADLREFPERATWVHISGATLALSKAMADVAERAVERGRAAGARISIDPNLRPEALTPQVAERIGRLAAGADVVLPSEGELEAIGLSLDAGPVVCTTFGDRGAEVLVAGKRERVAAPAVEERDPTGAGDAFAAAFVVATLEGAEPVEAARFGTSLGAQAVRHLGGMEAPVAPFSTTALGRVPAARESPASLDGCQ